MSAELPYRIECQLSILRDVRKIGCRLALDFPSLDLSFFFLQRHRRAEGGYARSAACNRNPTGRRCSRGHWRWRGCWRRYRLRRWRQRLLLDRCLWPHVLRIDDVAHFAGTAGLDLRLRNLRSESTRTRIEAAADPAHGLPLLRREL